MRKLVFDYETIGLRHQAADFKNLFGGWLNGETGEISYDNDPIFCFDPGDLLIGKNVPFDLKCLIKDKKDHAWIKNLFDVGVAVHLIREDLEEYSLEELVKYFRYPFPNYKYLVDFKSDYSSDMPTLKWYNRHDLMAPLWIYAKVLPILKRRGLMPLFNMMMELEAALSEIEMNGVQVDLAELDRQRQVVVGQRDKYLLALRAVDDIDWNSPQQVGDHFTSRRVKLFKTDKGNFSVNEVALQALSDGGNTTASHLLTLRGLNKKLGTYIGCRPDCTRKETEPSHICGGFEKQLINSRYYPSYNLTSTVTGRFSEHFIQVMPRKDTSEFKKCIISKFEGGELMEIDWSQLELRLIAEASADRNMQKELISGIDIHQRTLDQFPWLPNRTKAKNVNFLICYKGGAKKLAREYGFTEEQGQACIDGFFSRFPGIQQWHDQTDRECLTQGHVDELTGRRRHTTNLNEAINFKIQPLGHDLNKVAMIVLHQKLKGLKSGLVAEVHDSLIPDIHPTEKEDVKQAVRETYRDFKGEFQKRLDVELKMNYSVDVKIGKNLYDMEKVQL